MRNKKHLLTSSCRWHKTKQNELCPTATKQTLIFPKVWLTSLGKDTFMRGFSKLLGINNFITNIERDRYQNTPSLSLYLLTKAEQHLTKQGHAMEGGVGKRKTKSNRIQKMIINKVKRKFKRIHCF